MKMIIALSSLLFMRMAAIAEPAKSVTAAKMSSLTEDAISYVSAAAYIQDGLVAMWDGIENVGYGIHNPNATTWKDLTGNGYDCDLTTLIGTGCITVEDNSMLKEGYVRPSVAYTTSIDPQHWTIEGVVDFLNKDNANLHSGVGIYPIFIGVNQNTIIYGTYDSSTHHIRRSFSIWAGFSPEKAYGGLYGWIHSGTFTVVQNGFFTGGTSVQSSESYIFYNGITATQNSGGWSGSTTQPIQIAAFQSGNTQASFRAYCIRIYARSLSDEEIAYNYAIDKVRFNLP